MRPDPQMVPLLIDTAKALKGSQRRSCLFSHGLQDERCYVSAGSVDGALGW